jgi:alpha-beta hydrolase superfamily lysophospholipase
MVNKLARSVILWVGDTVRKARTGIRLAACVVAVTLVAAACDSDTTTESDSASEPAGPEGPAFYEPPSPLPAGAPGALIWARPIPAPAGAKAWKILYRSTLHDDQPVAVSGFVVAPTTPAPAGGRSVLAWAHGTTGGPRQCAPSLVADPARDLVNYFSYQSQDGFDVGVPALTEFVQAGYVVVATDYQGLGTPGIHQYTVGSTEARNVLDSVKAAQHVDSVGAGNDVVVLGWSQGGGASLFVGEQAAYGAPLRVLGSAALAPNADLGPQFAGAVAAGPSSPTSPSHEAALRINVFRGLAAAYPELKTDDVLTTAGTQALQGVGTQCIEHFANVIETNVSDPATLFPPGALPAAWQTRINENTPGSAVTAGPVLVMQGTADTVINPNATAQYIQRACAFSQPVQYSTYAGATHQTIPHVAQDDYVQWIADRFAGKPAPSNCPAGQ